MLLVAWRGSGGQMSGRQGHSARRRLLTDSVNIPVCVCVLKRMRAAQLWTGVGVRLAQGSTRAAKDAQTCFVQMLLSQRWASIWTHFDLPLWVLKFD